MHFTPYALPAIIALVIKAGIFFYARYSPAHNLQTRLYLLFLFSVSIQNLAEITFFTVQVDGTGIPPGVRLYFGASILAIAFFLHLALAVGKYSDALNNTIRKRDAILIYAPAIVLEILLWNGTLLVAGFQHMGYTYTKIPGPLYFLFEIYAIGYLGISAIIVFRGTFNQITAYRRLQNKLLLTGLLPIVLLVTFIIIFQRVGFREFNTTATLPFALSFFLGVTAYATHQHRLFDIQFFLPWSKIRKRKTEFYKRIQTLIAEISTMTSVNKVVQSLSETLRCPVALIGGPKPVLAIAGNALSVARFPHDELKKIDHIVVANEISDAMPATHALMKRHKIAAIVPFHPHSQAAASWMLLGDTFSDQVYSPIDFKTVETLFARLADHFLDNQLLLRAQLAEAQREMDALHGRLANAWEQIEDLRKRLATAEEKGRHLQVKSDMALHGRLLDVQSEILERFGSETKSLDDHVAEFEARLIAKTLEHCEDDVSRAADLLGLSPANLHYKLRNYLPSNLKKRH